MKNKQSGWVIKNDNHPTGTKPFIIASTFRYTRKECIKDFLIGTCKDWKYWRSEWNFECVKATQTVEILTTTN